MLKKIFQCIPFHTSLQDAKESLVQQNPIGTGINKATQTTDTKLDLNSKPNWVMLKSPSIRSRQQTEGHLIVFD